MSLRRPGSFDLDREVYRAHQAWVRRGRQGPGRIDAVGEKLDRLRAASHRLVDARFTRCDLTRCVWPHIDLVEGRLSRCDLQEADLHMANVVAASLEHCDLRRARLTKTRVVGAEVTECCLADAVAAHLVLQGTVVRRSSFAEAHLLDATFVAARVEDCDFRAADLSARQAGPTLGTTRGTRFVRCDFRSARFTGRTVAHTAFVECRFHGASGRMQLGDGVAFAGCDVSPDGDGSEIADDGAMRRQLGA